jgi:3-deoxy-7-phosphoheptulonate synthase
VAALSKYADDADLRGGAVAMGADALLIEVHPNPAEAWSDGTQQVSLEIFSQLMRELRPLILASGRE